MSKTIDLGNKDYSAETCSTTYNGYKYFGLQDPKLGGGSQCFYSNSLHDTRQFGPYTSTNCTPNGAPNCNYVYENK